jgi:hypothetical protein
MTLDADVVDQATSLEQVDDCQVGSRRSVSVGDAVVVQHQLGIREVFPRQREGVDDPVPAGVAIAAQCLDVVAVGGATRRVVQRLVDHFDLLDIRKLLRNRREPDANRFLLLGNRQAFDPGRLLVTPEQRVPLERGAGGARLVIGRACRGPVEGRSRKRWIAVSRGPKG